MQRVKRTQGRGRHGQLKDGACPPENNAWKMMIQRCINTNCPEFKNYGGRGIRVCERWLTIDGYANFVADLGPQPFAGAGLCRQDEARPFEPGNVFWGWTRGTVLTFEGRSMPLTEWAKERYMPPGTLRARLRNGWSVEAALSVYPQRRRPYHEWIQQGQEGHQNESSGL